MGLPGTNGLHYPAGVPLIYFPIVSLDGYITDTSGKFDWARPDLDVHAFVNDQVRDVGTYLYGRRLYETMTYWETADTGPSAPAVGRDFAEIWCAADKIVYSSQLTEPTTRRTRIERTFDPVAVADLVAASHRDVAIGGAELAAQAIRAGLVDELRMLVCPVVVGGGQPSLPGGIRWDLELLDERRFASGFVYLRYGARVLA